MSESTPVGPSDAGGRIVVGVDGSPSSEEALAWAARYAALTGLPVDAVITWQLPVAYGAGPVDGSIDFRAEAAEVLDKSVQNVVAGDDAARVRRIVLRGHPAEALLHAARGAELLVVGSRGHGGFAGMLLGSVSQHVVAHATCPVVVLHDQGGHAADAG
jgi:nucleotide-binding universal stress UspA family protein